MKDIFKDYLFHHGILVAEGAEKAENDFAFEIHFTIAKLFNIRITSGQMLADRTLIPYIGKQLGQDVPEPFYRGFPDSVRSLTSDELLFDQLLHYAKTYGAGLFDKQGHSLLEDFMQRSAFNEECEIKNFIILSETEAAGRLGEYTENLLAGTRPVNDDQFAFICEYIQTYDYQIKDCASKNTAIRLLLTFRNVRYADFIAMSDVIKLTDELNYQYYCNENIRKLNLKNQDRKFITQVMNHLFRSGRCDLQNCYEKKAVWSGLLHHIHYRPIDEISAQFVQSMRGKENHSVYAKFEKVMAAHDIREAATVLEKGKGSGAVLRNLNYILSRCESEEDVQFVIRHVESSNGLMLLQLFIEYSTYRADAARRTFKFISHNRLTIHTETDWEIEKRQSVIPEKTAVRLCEAIGENLKRIYAGALGKVYIDSAMKRMALPIQEAASSSGYGALPRGSRLHIEEGKKIRAFTYWEKVNDIDLSVIGLRADGTQMEFSWRTMRNNQSAAITFSGDETSGYHGGSEYFDIDVKQFKKLYPQITHLVFCDNVYTPGVKFSQCVCRAGYMTRDIRDSGEVYEPKTVKSSFTVDCDSRFAYLFAIDITANDFIWLNIARDSYENVAGATSLAFLTTYFDIVSVMNLHKFFSMLATEVVEDIDQADVAVTDASVCVEEGTEVIRSYDTERIAALMNLRK